MATKAKTDQFPNKAIQRVTQAAINTLVFQEINFAAGVFQRIALVIHRITYTPGSGMWSDLLTGSDLFRGGITVSNGIVDLARTHPELIDQVEYVGFVSGTPASGEIVRGNVMNDFTSMPGGGILIPASPVYVAIYTSGFASVANMDVQIDFTFKELADADYIELIQSRVQANV